MQYNKPRAQRVIVRMAAPDVPSAGAAVPAAAAVGEEQIAGAVGGEAERLPADEGTGAAVTATAPAAAQ